MPRPGKSESRGVGFPGISPSPSLSETGPGLPTERNCSQIRANILETGHPPSAPRDHLRDPRNPGQISNPESPPDLHR